MSMLTPKVVAPPPAPPAPEPVDMGRARAMAEEAMGAEMRRRKGRGSTIVAGALQDTAAPSSGTPTLMG